MLYIILIFLILGLGRNLLVLRDQCFHCNDFAMFVETLNKLVRGDLNPYLDTRQLNYFNDHWEPIFYVAGVLYWPFHFFWGAASFLLTLDAVIFALAAWLLVRERRTNWMLALLLAAALLLNTEYLGALRYPVRPSNWALLFGAGLVVLFDREFLRGKVQPWYIWILALLGLSLCNEQHALTAVVVVLVQLAILPKRWRLWSALFVVVLFQALWAWKLRGQFLGAVKDYSYYFAGSAEVLKEWYGSKDSIYKVIGFLLPLMGLGFVLFKGYRSKQQSRASFFAFFASVLFWGALFGPGFLGRLLTGSWNQYYSAWPLLAIVSLLFLLIPAATVISKKLLWLGLLLPGATILDDVRLLAVSIYHGQSERCIQDYHRHAKSGELPGLILRRKRNTEMIEDIIKNRSISQTQGKNQNQNQSTEQRMRVLLSDIRVPSFVSRYPNHSFFILGGSWIKNADTFDLAIFDRQGLSSSYPLTKEQYEEAIVYIKGQPGVRVDFEDSDLVILSGPIHLDGVRHFYGSDLMK